MNKRIILIPAYVALLFLSSCQPQLKNGGEPGKSQFSFVFMTDIHLQPESNAVEGFQTAIDSVNKLKPDFVITGGDLVMDALGVKYNRADSLYHLYKEVSGSFEMPVYNTMGNHEIFGIYDQRGTLTHHPEYGEKMFEKRIGKRYYSFDHKGWHFIILDGIEDTGEGSYIGFIDDVQMKWIKADLEKVDSTTPIAISTHIPLITVVTQLERGALEPNGKGTVVNNAKEVLDLFDGHNLKLVMQGHLHYLEDIYAGGVHFITGGAVSARWWAGPYRGMEEGFVLFHVSGESFTWDYIDYGWDAQTTD